MEKKEQFILETLVKHYGILSFSKLLMKTGLSQSELCSFLTNLKKEGFIEEEENQYRLVKEFFKVGQIIKKEDHYFVNIDEEIPIFDTHLKHSQVGDYVFVRIQNYKTKYEHAIVEERLQHELGEVYEEEGEFYIQIHSKVKDLKIKIENSDGLISGLMVNFEYVKELGPQLYSAKVLRIVGHKNNPNMNYQKLVTSRGIETEFPYGVIQAVGKLPSEVKLNEKQNRVDLTEELIYTIDGESSKDFDDAISIKKQENGNYILSVHIADVSHYVKEGSIIDEEAYKRTSSVYVMGRVAPMLPYKLSNGICSLNEKVDRLTITCKMEIDPKGSVVNRSVFKSVINSKKRMTYQTVNDILKLNKVPKDYEMFLESLKIGEELYYILNQKRVEEGSIEFDVPEIHFSFDAYGRPTDVYARKRDVAERMIEEFMLVANRTVAELLKGFPSPRRVNPKPDIFILKEVIPIIESLYENQTWNADILPILEEIKTANRDTYIQPKKIQLLLDALRQNKEDFVPANLILSSMKRAYYTTSDDEHYALAFHDYTHFTSPIRRYSDLVVHRMIKQFLLRKDFDYDTICMLKTRNQRIVEHISKKEKDIQKCERIIDSIKQAEYMKNHVGEEFHGYIDAVSKHGLQVCFQDVIYGKVPFPYLEGYQYDGKNKIYRNPEGDIYQLGDSISVIVENIDFENSIILLKPVKEAIKTYRLR